MTFKEEIIHCVIKQIHIDIQNGWDEDIAKLLNHISIYNLIDYLPELTREQRKKWEGSIV